MNLFLNINSQKMSFKGIFFSFYSFMYPLQTPTQLKNIIGCCKRYGSKSYFLRFLMLRNSHSEVY